MKLSIASLLFFLCLFMNGCATTNSQNIDDEKYLNVIALNTVEYLEMNKLKYPDDTIFNINTELAFGKILAAKISDIGGYKIENLPKAIPITYKIDYLDNNQIILLLNMKYEYVSKIYQKQDDSLIPVSHWTVLENSK